MDCTILIVQSNLFKANFRGPTKFVLIIRSSSYQDIVIHVQYYSRPNRAWKLQYVVCVKQKFVLRVFFLMRFFCNSLQIFLYMWYCFYEHGCAVCISRHGVVSTCWNVFQSKCALAFEWCLHVKLILLWHTLYVVALS